MQKVINVLAVLSFVGTAGIVGGGTALYLNKDSIIENAKIKSQLQQQKQLLVLFLE
jgi:NADH:ubiquinone oxidoreductase subunit 5 (subunit L)/multisubunit Na+/H+ antiporter MnhA subunit